MSKYKVGDKFEIVLRGGKVFLEITNYQNDSLYKYICNDGVREWGFSDRELDGLKKLEEEPPEPKNKFRGVSYEHIIIDWPYETHLWVQLELSDGRIVESPEPEGDEWVVFKDVVGHQVDVDFDHCYNLTDMSQCWIDEYRKMGEDGWVKHLIEYRRPIPQKETYECLADYPLLMGGEG